MQKKLLAIGMSLSLLAFANSCAHESTKPKDEVIPDPPTYLGLTSPGDTAIVFAPINDSIPGRSYQKVSFSPDMKECLVGIRTNNRCSILYSKYDNGIWANFDTANFIVANQQEKEPFFSPDGNTIYFVRYASIWTSKRLNQSWATPEMLGSPINVEAEQYHPTVTSNGKLYFCSNRGGAYNIYRSPYDNGSYSTVELLDSLINSHVEGSDGAYDPYIAPDESYLIFTSIRSGGLGMGDQYISYNTGGQWTEPVNLGMEINTAGLEYGSNVSPDGKYYFFAIANNMYVFKLYWVRSSFIDSLKQANFAPNREK